jgi:hypothetical protein
MLAQANGNGGIESDGDKDVVAVVRSKTKQAAATGPDLRFRLPWRLEATAIIMVFERERTGLPGTR